MGILFNTAHSLLLERQRRPFKGALLALGKQDVYLSWETLHYIALKMGIVLKCIPAEDVETNNKSWCVSQKYITDTTFFKALGFSDVESMDCSDYEGAGHIRDLNRIISSEFYDKYDVIFDGGTCEHIFHIPNFMTNICLMLRKNGRVIHENPCAGVLDHGFYNISPTLYYDFYNINGFEVNKLSVFKQSKDLMLSQLFEEREYVPGDYDLHRCYLPDNNLYCTFCIATKIKDFDELKIPRQSIWDRIGC